MLISECTVKLRTERIMTTNQQLDKLCLEHFGNRKYVADGIFHESAESRWEMEKPKVLFVMKQPNSNNLLGEDYRTYELHDVLLGNQNWEQLFARLYGIIHTTAQGYPSYKEATRQESMIEAFTQHAFAMINIDKEHGFGTTDTAELKRYAQENASFIRRQIEILAPDIIVCCGQGVFDIVNGIMQPAAPTSSNWTKYNKVLGILYFDTYHPGKPMAGQRLSDAYEMPLKELMKI